MIGVCIAAKNEARTIRPLVCTLSRLNFKVYVMDDGSRDGTYWEATLPSDHNVHVLFHPESQGIAHSLMDVLGLAVEKHCDRIVQMDAGGSHQETEVVWLADGLLEDGGDVVIGSRFVDGANYVGRPWRQRLSRLASLMCNLAMGTRHTDWTSGFRAFKPDALQPLLAQPYRAKMHGWQIEVLAHAHRLGLKVVERPITYVAGESSFNWKVALEAFRVWLTLFHLGLRQQK